MKRKTLRGSEKQTSTKPFIVNTTKKTILAQQGFILTNPLRQAVGTMFHRLPGSYIFVFASPRRVAITNLFVFQSLDILWLDSRGKILATRERFLPFAPHVAPDVQACAVVELPAGTIAATRTVIGDVLKWSR